MLGILVAIIAGGLAFAWAIEPLGLVPATILLIAIVTQAEPAPLILGFILGPLMEEHLRRAMLLSRGSLDVFINRLISSAFLAVTAMLLSFAVYVTIRGTRKPVPMLLRAATPGS